MSTELDIARDIARTLIDAGHETYFAGGCVRDRLLGKPPVDVDIATAAHPEQVESLFKRTLAVGKQFGVIVVIRKRMNFEVATFRSDGAYVDGRRPETVTFTTAKEDVLRRDFTINGLLWHPVTDEIIDHVGGRTDLEGGVIRTIGDPVERFTEDRLRILRAVRFATRLDFAIEERTFAAIRSMAAAAERPSAERIFGELDRMLTERDPARAVELMDELGLLEVILPELQGLEGLEHRVGALESLGSGHRAAAFAILLDDLSEALPVARARAAVDVLKRLRASNALVDAVRSLVLCRDRTLHGIRISAARRAIVAADPFLEVRRVHADAWASVTPRSIRKGADLPGSAALPPPLLDGRELMALGVPKGRGLGRMMRLLRHRQLDGALVDAEAARTFVKDSSRPR